VHYTAITHNKHLRTWRSCRKHKFQVGVFYISRVFSNMSGVFYRSVIHSLSFFICFFALWYRGNVAKNNKPHFFCGLYYTLINHGFLTNQSMHTYIYILDKYIFILFCDSSDLTTVTGVLMSSLIIVSF